MAEKTFTQDELNRCWAVGGEHLVKCGKKLLMQGIKSGTWKFNFDVDYSVPQSDDSDDK